MPMWDLSNTGETERLPDLSIIRLKWLINKLLNEKKASKETLKQISDELLVLKEKIQMKERFQNYRSGDSFDPQARRKRY